MAELKISPGLWKLGEENFGGDPPTITVFADDGGWGKEVAIVSAAQVPIEQLLPNALLLRAAPLLLDACRLALEAWRDAQATLDEFEEWKAAHRATGEALEAVLQLAVDGELYEKGEGEESAIERLKAAQVALET